MKLFPEIITKIFKAVRVFWRWFYWDSFYLPRVFNKYR